MSFFIIFLGVGPFDVRYLEINRNRPARTF